MPFKTNPPEEPQFLCLSRQFFDNSKIAYTIKRIYFLHIFKKLVCINISLHTLLPTLFCLLVQLIHSFNHFWVILPPSVLIVNHIKIVICLLNFPPEYFPGFACIILVLVYATQTWIKVSEM